MKVSVSQSDVPHGAPPLCGPCRTPAAGVQKFFIGKYVFICQTRRHWVILDAHNDQYYCIPARAFASLATLIHGWKHIAPEVPSELHQYTEDTSSLAAQLIAKGVLCENLESGRELILAPPTAPTSVLDTGDLPTLSYRTLLAPTFLLACITTRRLLRRFTFEFIIRGVERRRMRNAHQPNPDYQELADLVATFNSLRLWYPRTYLCLFDSLALLEFLAWRGVFPRWTFGVMADPFLAHCWLQDGSVVLNDTLSRVSGYIPIMSV